MARRPPPPAGPARPRPPAAILEQLFTARFAPAPELGQWVREQILEDGGRLHNPDHRHLLDASIGWLWASEGYTKAGRRILGLTEDVDMIRGNPWATGRAEQQLREWFGEPPRFLITLDAVHCADAPDADFCALVEHELYHCGHRCDEFGNPSFTRDGRPKLGIRGHDVEEFVGVVRRYGVGDPGGYLGQLIIAAAQGPEVAPLRIAQACGTCHLKAVA
jgi:hypothetical protein